jgi:hypothetical protein
LRSLSPRSRPRSSGPDGRRSGPDRIPQHNRHTQWPRSQMQGTWVVRASRVRCLAQGVGDPRRCLQSLHQLVPPSGRRFPLGRHPHRSLPIPPGRRNHSVTDTGGPVRGWPCWRRGLLL